MHALGRHISTRRICLVVLLAASVAQATLIDHRATQDASVYGYNAYAAPDEGAGFRIDWEISVNVDGTWHYEYTFSDESGNSLTPAASHIILQLSDNITSADLFNYTGDIAQPVEFGTFGPASSNPGFPTGESISGIKFELGGAQTHIEFDSTRQPMWADFYVKGGGGQKVAYAYNSDLGVPVANPDDYNGIPVDGNGLTLDKILAPDTYVPEPATSTMLAFGLGTMLLRRCRR